jgi:hypothetical protein
MFTYGARFQLCMFDARQACECLQRNESHPLAALPFSKKDIFVFYGVVCLLDSIAGIHSARNLPGALLET